MSCRRASILACGLVLAISACGGGSDEAEDAGGASEPTVTAPADPDPSPTTRPKDPDATGFAATVLPIVEDTCARCHTGDGPGTPFLRMDTVAELVDNVSLISSVLDTNEMPPWPASELSVAFADDWSLSADDRQTLLTWSGGGAIVDIDESTVVSPSTGVRRLSNPDLELASEGSYDGTRHQSDEYRCLVYDPGFTEPSWIQGFEFVPDQTEVVHHAIGYLASGDLRDRATELDAEQPEQGGWSCFGGSRLGRDEIFLGWAPGQGPAEFPPGSGLRMEAGEFIVMQIHYHFEVEAPADRSTLRLDLVEDDGAESLDEVDVVEFLAPAEIPCTTDEEGPLCDRDAALRNAVEAYGEDGVRADAALLICRSTLADFAHMTNGTASSSCDLPARAKGELISVLGHEHEIGSSFRMTLNPDTADELVLLDIPDWSFDWQLLYHPLEAIDIDANDIVRIECSWDRSRRDPDLEPAYVLWADGTNDEMCFAIMVIRTTGG